MRTDSKTNPAAGKLHFYLSGNAISDYYFLFNWATDPKTREEFLNSNAIKNAKRRIRTIRRRQF